MNFTPFRCRRNVAGAVLLSALLWALFGAATASSFLWSSAVTSTWNANRWIIDGNTTLSCCPTINDTVFINKTSAFTYTVRANVAAEANSTFVGLEGGNAMATLEVQSFRSVTVTSELAVFNGATVSVLTFGELRMLEAAIATFHPLSTLLLDGGAILCQLPRTCNYVIEGGSLSLAVNSFGDINDANLSLTNSFNPTVIDETTMVTTKNAAVTFDNSSLHVYLGFFRATAASAIQIRNTELLISPPTLVMDNANVEFWDSIASVSNCSVNVHVGGKIYSSGSVVLILDSKLNLTTGGIIWTEYDAKVSIVNSSIDGTNSHIHGYYASYQINDTSVALRNGTSMYIRILATATIETSTFSFNNKSYLIAEFADVSFSNSSVDLQQSSALSAGTQSNLHLDGTTISVDSSSAILVTSSSTLVATDSEIVIAGGLSCTQSTVNVDNVILTSEASLEFDRCEGTCYNISSTNTLVLLNDSNIYLTQTKFERSTRVQVQFGSALHLGGDLVVLNSSLIVVSSSIDISGSLMMSDCLAAPASIWESLPAGYWPSCEFVAWKSSFNTTGDLVFDTHSTMVAQESRVSLGGQISFGNESQVVWIYSNISSGASITVGARAKVLQGRSSVKVDAGGVVLRDNCNWTISEGSLEVNGGSLNFSTGAFLVLHRSVATIKDTINVFGDNGPKFSALYMRESEVTIEGGSVEIAGRSASVVVDTGSYLSIKSGGIMAKNGSIFVVTSNASFDVSGGDIAADFALLRFDHCTVRVSEGNFVIKNGSFVQLSSVAMYVSGSIYSSDDTFWEMYNQSELVLDGGVITMDEIGYLQLHGQSSISGVGAITGTVEIFNGTITYDRSNTTAVTQLSFSHLVQRNESLLEAALNSSSYGALGASTHVEAHTITVGGTLILSIDGSTAILLRNNQSIELMRGLDSIDGTFDRVQVSGAFDSISTLIDNGPACGLTLKQTTRSLSVLFDLSGCTTPATPVASTSPPEAQQQPIGSTAEISSPTAAIAAGMIVAIVIVLIIVGIIVVMRSPTLRAKVMPWRSKEPPAQHTTDQELEEAPAAPTKTSSSWQAVRPTAQ